MAVGIFRVQTDVAAPVGGLVVNLTVSGTATPAVDYVALPASVTIPAGQTFFDVTITPISDALIEGDETVIVDIAADAAYTVGAPLQTTVIIRDATVPPPLPVVSLVTVQNTANEAAVVLNDVTSSSSITFSNNFLTMDALTASVGFATLGRSAGQFVFEVTFDIITNAISQNVGIADAAHPLVNSIGQTIDSFGYNLDNTSKNNGTGFTLPPAAVPVQGDTIGINVDFTAGNIVVKNASGGSIALFTAVTLNNVPLFPAAFVINSAKLTFNFGASAFITTPLAGHLNWDGS